MRHPTLSTKLLAAALPLVLVVAALLGLAVRSDLADARNAETGAELGAVWEPLIAALATLDAETGEVGDGAAAMPATRRTTDQAINALRDQIESLDAFDAASRHITDARSALSAARRNLDMAIVAPDLPLEVDPLEAYGLASRELVAVGQLLPSEAGDPILGRELLAVVKLAEAKLSANAAITGTTQWRTDPTDITPLTTARNAYSEMEATLGEFEAIAPEEWATQYRQSGFPTELAKYRGDLDQAMRSVALGDSASFDTDSFTQLVADGVQFQSAISQSIVESASLQATSARRTTLIRIATSLGAVLLAAFITLLITRSITRRVRAVSASAKQVTTEQLPALVEALRDPRGRAVLPNVQPVDAKGSDELAELAAAFNSMQDTLVEVAHEQVEVLRRGVSEIFVTMARRNRSLIDRQLALLDEFEAEVDDPTVLGNYYQLDHLATRMRRNSEALLVLANAEPKRRRVRETEIDDVVRASIGEVEDYRRVDVEHLEPLKVRGTVVADVAHMIAELLDNATSFSPPESAVRVGGRHAGDSYLLRIVDSGIGIPTDRMRYLNDLLSDPPVAGLSVESTLGISVVSMLANKHGITVVLSAGNPGLSVDISLPSSLFGPIEQPTPTSTEAAWNDDDSAFLAQSQIDPAPDAIPELDAPPKLDDRAPEPVQHDERDPGFDRHQPADIVEPWDAQPVAASDWTRMSLDLSAFQAGRRSATIDTPSADVPHRAPESTFDAGADFVPVASDKSAAAAPPEPDLPEPDLTELPLPPPAVRLHGEFDSPLAPPVTADGPSRGPVAPTSARSTPDRLPGDPTPPSLPTRTSGIASEHPDRLIEVSARHADPHDPSDQERTALLSALAAFGAGSTGSLPTRTRHEDTMMTNEEPPIPTTPSQLDPEALRQRLRAFQTEFTIGGGSPDSLDEHGDVGGDRR